MGIRAAQQEARDQVVIEAATKLFWSQGYTPTTIPQIAELAGVAVGTVAKVGSKDELFLRVWEESSTTASLQLIAQAKALEGTVTDRVWTYLGSLLEAAIGVPDGMRDYFVAYLRASDHGANQRRLEEVMAAIGELFGPDGSAEAVELATITVWLAFSALAFALAANSFDPAAARETLRAVVVAQCAPFETGAQA